MQASLKKERDAERAKAAALEAEIAALRAQFAMHKVCSPCRSHKQLHAKAIDVGVRCKHNSQLITILFAGRRRQGEQGQQPQRVAENGFGDHHAPRRITINKAGGLLVIQNVAFIAAPAQ